MILLLLIRIAALMRGWPRRSHLDLGRGAVPLNGMGSIRRTINLIIALTLAALGCGGLVYFYFIAATWNGWMTAAAAIVGFAGLYWLWDEHINADPRLEN